MSGGGIGIGGVFRDNAPSGSLRAFTHVRSDDTGTYFSFLQGRWLDEFLRLYCLELFADRAVSFREAPGMYPPLALDVRPPCDLSRGANHFAERVLKHAGDLFEDAVRPGTRCVVLAAPNGSSTRLLVPGVRAAKFLQRLVAERVNADPQILTSTESRCAPVPDGDRFMYGSSDGRRDPLRAVAVLRVTGRAARPSVGRDWDVVRHPLPGAMDPQGLRRTIPALARLLRDEAVGASADEGEAGTDGSDPYCVEGEGEAARRAAEAEELRPGASDAFIGDVSFVVQYLGVTGPGSSEGAAARSEVRKEALQEVRRVKRESLRAQGKLSTYEDLVGLAGRNNSSGCLSSDSAERQSGVDYARKLVVCLCDERSDDFTEWIKVGSILRNVDDNLLSTWVEFSQRSTKYVAGECERLWRKFRPSTDASLMTLRRLACEDDREKFITIDSIDLWKAVKIFLESNLEFDAAVILHKLLGETHRFDGKFWWAFHDHRWVKDMRAARFKKTFTGAVHREISKLIEVHGNEGDDIAKWVTLTKTTRGRDKLVIVSQDLFQDQSFSDRLNHNGSLLVVKNGVYDFKNREFRDGRPDDMVSICSEERTYRPLSDYDFDEIEAIMDPLRKMIPSKDVLEFLLRKLGLMLNGDFYDPKLCFFVGRGSNGKSVLMQLLQTTLGQYYGKVNVTMITAKRPSAGAANPELADTQHKRCVSCDEPSKADGAINPGVIKHLTGRDQIVARGLFQDNKTFLPQFSIFVLCNRVPDIPSADWGTLRRLQMVEWKAQFKEDPDPNKPLEFKADPDIEVKLKEHADVFLSLLIEYHNKAMAEPEGRPRNPEPAEVTALTESYRRDANRIKQFVDAVVERKEGGVLVLKDAFREFKMFSEENGMVHAETTDTFRRSLADALDADPEQRPGGKYVWENFSLRNF